jgi:hypothetical protein
MNLHDYDIIMFVFLLLHQILLNFARRTAGCKKSIFDMVCTFIFIFELECFKIYHGIEVFYNISCSKLLLKFKKKIIKLKIVSKISHSRYLYLQPVKECNTVLSFYLSCTVYIYMAQVSLELCMWLGIILAIFGSR